MRADKLSKEIDQGAALQFDEYFINNQSSIRDVGYTETFFAACDGSVTNNKKRKKEKLSFPIL